MRKFWATVFAVLFGLCFAGLCLTSGDAAFAAETAATAFPDRKDNFFIAVKTAQDQLAEAVKNNNAEAAAKAADALKQALAIYRAEPTPKEMIEESNNLAAWLKAYKDDAPPGLVVALNGLAQAIASYRAVPGADEVRDRMNELGVWLASGRVPASTDTTIAPALAGLVQSVATYRGLGTADFVENASADLKGWISPTNWGPNDKLEKVLGLAEAIMTKMRVVNPDKAAESFDRMAKIMVGTEVKDAVYRPPFERVTYATEMESALKALNDPVAKARPADWFATQGDEIKELLGGDTDAEIAATESRRALLQNDAKVMASAKAAKATIELLQGGYRPQVHIIDALYGDLPTGPFSRRVCDATRSMVTACERKDKCNLPPDYVTSLCGFDPIPSADDRTRRVAVHYACFSGGDAVWDRLATHPLEDPFDFSDLSKFDNPANRFAELRGVKMELRCPADILAPTVTK